MQKTNTCPDSLAPSLELASILKAAAVLLAINFFIGVWLWISPNLDEIAPATRGSGEAMAVASPRPSPFDFVRESKRKVVKAVKLTPMLIPVAAADDMIASNASVTDIQTDQ